MAKQYRVWELLWMQKEYGGTHQSAGATLHLTAEDALAYKEQRERGSQWSAQNDHMETAGPPRPKLVSRAVYEGLKQASQQKPPEA